jgi:hypothetical protein
VNSSLEQVISSEARAAFLYQLVSDHLVEVNSFGDRLRYLRKNPDKARPNAARALMLRCANHAEAISMMGETVLPILGQWAEENLKHPVDAFALGFAVSALGGDLAQLALTPEALLDAQHGAEVRELLPSVCVIGDEYRR